MGAQPIVPSQPSAPASESTVSPNEVDQDVTASWAAGPTHIGSDYPAPAAPPPAPGEGAGSAWASPAEALAAWAEPAAPGSPIAPEGLSAPESAPASTIVPESLSAPEGLSAPESVSGSPIAPEGSSAPESLSAPEGLSTPESLSTPEGLSTPESPIASEEPPIMAERLAMPEAPADLGINTVEENSDKPEDSVAAEGLMVPEQPVASESLQMPDSATEPGELALAEGSPEAKGSVEPASSPDPEKPDAAELQSLATSSGLENPGELPIPTTPDPLTDPLTGPWTPDPESLDWSTPLSWAPEPEPAKEPESAGGGGVAEHPIPTPDPYPGLYLGGETQTDNQAGPEPTPEPDVAASPNGIDRNETDQTPAHTVDIEQVRAGIQAGLEDAEAIAASLALAADKLALTGLGVPTEWISNLQTGDRFMAVVQMLGELPEPTIPDDVQVIAVVGAADVVGLEAARTALDLPHEGGPRPVVTIPVEVGPARLEALDLGAATRPVVVSIPVAGDGTEEAEKVREILQHVQAEAVIAVLDATRSLDENRRWVADLGQVDAVALDGALDSGEPAAVLQLGVPVVRLDGIGVDRVGWAAVLCTQLAVGGATS